jgi:hypothetical protein
MPAKGDIYIGVLVALLLLGVVYAVKATTGKTIQF